MNRNSGGKSIGKEKVMKGRKGWGKCVRYEWGVGFEKVGVIYFLRVFIYFWGIFGIFRYILCFSFFVW